MNRAPERIYLDKSIYAITFPDGTHGGRVLFDRLDDDDIEYTRSDLMPRWVSVEKETPLKTGFYFVRQQHPNGMPSRGVVFFNGIEWHPSAEHMAVTHWLKNIPKLPEGE